MPISRASPSSRSLFSIDLERPLPLQYVEFIGSLAHGDLGYSFVSQGTPVTSIVLAVLPWTLLTVGTGVFLSFAAGVFLGLVAAYNRNKPIDHVLTRQAIATRMKTITIAGSDHRGLIAHLHVP